MNIMNYEVLTKGLDSVDLSERQVINTINPHSYITAKGDLLFSNALNGSDLLIPDGSGFVLAAKIINKEKIEKVAGFDLHKFLLERFNQKNGKIFYLGASEETLASIHTKVADMYPSLEVQSYSPPYKEQFSEEDNRTIITKVNSFKPDVLFIGMTAPKQEKWLQEHKDELHFTIASSIGAVFDFYAGTVVRPSQFWIDIHMEWLPRLLKEPRRLWKRNFVSTPLFLLDILLYKIKYYK